MTYQTLMVHVDIGTENTGLLKVAGDLAEQFEADVIGVGAYPPAEVNYYGEAYLMADFLDQDRSKIEQEAKLAEERFRSSLHNRAHSIEWRPSVPYDFAADYVAQQSRAADLILIRANGGGKQTKGAWRGNIGDLVMRAGRPILVVGDEEPAFSLQNAIVAWKDTTEARRAVSNALPLLKKAQEVAVIEIAPTHDLADAQLRVRDVCEWLKRHGVSAQSQAFVSDGDDAGHLNRLANEKKAGLLVGGAYGHNRLREWVLGGVTRDLFLRTERCSLISH